MGFSTQKYPQSIMLLMGFSTQLHFLPDFVGQRLGINSDRVKALINLMMSMILVKPKFSSPNPNWGHLANSIHNRGDLKNLVL